MNEKTFCIDDDDQECVVEAIIPNQFPDLVVLVVGLHSNDISDERFESWELPIVAWRIERVDEYKIIRAQPVLAFGELNAFNSTWMLFDRKRNVGWDVDDCFQGREAAITNRLYWAKQYREHRLELRKAAAAKATP